MARLTQIQIKLNKKLMKRLQKDNIVMKNALDLIEYMNGLTSVDEKEFEHYANRVMNTMAELENQIIRGD